MLSTNKQNNKKKQKNRVRKTTANITETQIEIFASIIIGAIQRIAPIRKSFMQFAELTAPINYT